MNLLMDSYVFYADVYFVQNFIIKTVILYLSLYCNKCFFMIDTIKGIGKIMLAAGIGTMFEIVGLLLGNSYRGVLLLVSILEMPIMVWLVLGKNRRQSFSIMITGYFFVIVINGILEILWNWLGNTGSNIIYLSISCGIVYCAVRIWLNTQRMTQGIFPVFLRNKDKEVMVYGLYDTGNQLMEPCKGKAVHIVAEKIMKELQLEHNKAVYIPYQSLGNEHGVVAAYSIEYIGIQKEHSWIEKKDAIIGSAEDSLFEGKRYQVILNAELE